MKRNKRGFVARYSAFWAHFNTGLYVWLWGLSAVGYCFILLIGHAPDHGHHNAMVWPLMCIAMMSPMIASTMAYCSKSVGDQVQKRTAIAVFTGYHASWILAGVILIPLSIVLARFPAAFTVLGLVILAIYWSASPIAQHFRNLCHAVRPIRPFGAQAIIDGFVIGARDGMYCVGICWPLMLIPSQIASGHVIAMIGVGILMFADRLAPSRSPGWQWPPVFESLFGARAMRQLL